MIRVRFAAAAALALAATALSVSAQSPSAAIPDGKVVVLNTSAFPGQIGELKQKYDQVEGQFKDRYQKLQALDAQVKELENQIATQQQTLSAEKLQDLRNKYDDMKRQGTRQAEDFQADYQKALEAATKPIRDKLQQFVSNYAGQHGIVMIINLPVAAQAGTIAYVSPGSDITTDFIAQYNKANPVPGGASSTTPGAAKPGQD